MSDAAFAGSISLPRSTDMCRPIGTAVVDELGELDAIAALVPRFDRLLRGIARRHGLTADETEDLVQQTWLRLCEHFATIRDAQRLPGWLATTARRECFAVRRRGSREDPLENLSELPSSECDPIGSVIRKEQEEAVREAIASLPAREGQVMRCFLADDPLTYDEISARLAMPHGSIGPIRRRALRRLAHVLEACRSS